MASTINAHGEGGGLLIKTHDMNRDEGFRIPATPRRDIGAVSRQPRLRFLRVDKRLVVTLALLRQAEFAIVLLSIVVAEWFMFAAGVTTCGTQSSSAMVVYRRLEVFSAFALLTEH